MQIKLINNQFNRFDRAKKSSRIRFEICPARVTFAFKSLNLRAFFIYLVLLNYKAHKINACRFESISLLAKNCHQK